MLADEGTQRHAGDQGHGEAGEHDGDRAGGLFLRHQAGGDGRADGEEHPVGEARDQPRGDQRFIARRLPGQQVAEGEEHHQRQQQPLARQLAGEGGEHRRTDGDAQGVEADQQARRGQADAEVGGDGGDQADDDELRRADGEGAQGQRQQGEGHGGWLR
ncbi:hypothetical protein D9M70_497530 [compost metagenome]